MDWGAAAGFTEVFSPMFLQAAKTYKSGVQEKEAKAHALEMNQLQHEAQSPDPEIRNLANAGIFLRAKESQPGYKGKPVQNLLEQIHSRKFMDHEAYKQFVEIGNSFEAGKKVAAGGGGGEAAGGGMPPMGGPPSVPPPQALAAPQPQDQGFGDNAPGAAPVTPAPPQPAAQIEGTGNISPAAANPAAGLGGPPPTPQATLYAEADKRLGPRDAMGSYGKAGDAMLPQINAGLDNEKEAKRREASTKAANAREDARKEAAKLKREGDMERVIARIDAQKERLKETLAFKAKHGGKSSGPKQGINFDKERLEAASDRERFLNQLEAHAQAEQAQLDARASRDDMSPAEMQAAQSKLDASVARQRAAIDKHHLDVMKLLLPGGGPPSTGLGTPPPEVGDAGGAASSTPTKAAGSPAASQPIIQRNKETGAYRHSIDGGKTWKPGKPAGQ